MNIVLTKQTIEGKLIETTNGRDLQRELENTTAHNMWITRALEAAYLVENVDYTILCSDTTAGGVERKDYFLTIESAKAIAMMQRSEIGKRVRDYYIELEKGKTVPVSNLTPEQQALFQVMSDTNTLKAQQQILAQDQETQAKKVEAVEQTVNEMSTQQKQGNTSESDPWPVGHAPISAMDDLIDIYLAEDCYRTIAIRGTCNFKTYQTVTRDAKGNIVNVKKNKAYEIKHFNDLVHAYTQQSVQVSPKFCKHPVIDKRYRYIKPISAFKV